MILLDTNILVYASNENCPEYPAVSGWLQEIAGEETIGLPSISLWGFLRIATNPRSTIRPLTLTRAFEVVREWLALSGVGVIEPGARHFETLERLATAGQARGPLMSDAVLAAIAIEHGAVLASTDRDFTRFPGLRWVNPLA